MGSIPTISSNNPRISAGIRGLLYSCVRFPCYCGGGTLVSSICPWAATAMYNYATLGIHPLEYVPYLYFNLVNIALGIILPIIGLTIFTKERVDTQRQKAQNTKKA
ncbi:MAG: hypothetical protein HFF50_03135 [Lawsonibacter sp.]|nr:hypothetical protein [Lawsonibacter sp.]